MMEEETAACVRLARAKLFSMFQDLAGQTPGPPAEKSYNRDQAHRWFFNESDFELWCDMAGYDPRWVRQKARKVAITGFTARTEWRTSPRYEERKRYRDRIKAEREARL